VKTVHFIAERPFSFITVPADFSDSAKLLVKLVQKILFLVVVKAVIANHAETGVGDMNDDLFKQIETGLFDNNTFLCAVIIIEPFNSIGVFVIPVNAAFSHGRPGSVTHHIVHAGTDIAGRRSLGLFGVDIVAFILIDITGVHVFAEGLSEVFEEKPVKFVLPGFSERSEIEVMDFLVRILFGIIDEFRD